MTTPITRHISQAEQFPISRNLQFWIDKCHGASVRAGWWPDTEYTSAARAQLFATKIALIHSELSEALEGLRRHSQDEHLPTRRAIEVELADATIRTLDLLGAAQRQYTSERRQFAQALQADELLAATEAANKHSVVESLARLHYFVAAALLYESVSIWGISKQLIYVIALLEALANKLNFDLIETIEAKMAYNAERADHKLEARNAPNGKRF